MKKKKQATGFPEALLETIISPLIAWYAGASRPMPWRMGPTPYRVWISEVMLQQTRISAVVPYFERFVKALPSVQELAKVPEEQLLKLWEGLGYYSRARNLKKAAVEIVEKYDGELPASREALLSLPGIGDYTAGAIASIAFGLPCPAVDGNVLRVISRVCDCDRNILDAATKRDVIAALGRVYPSGQEAATLTEALMELGESVCVPGMPRCLDCPLSERCRGLAAGTMAELPVREGRKERRIEERTVFLLENGGRYAIGKRPDRGLLASMYEFPSAEERLTPEEAALWAASRGLAPLDAVPEGTARHVFTHVEWHMTLYRLSCRREGGGDFLWASPAEIKERYALPRAFRAALEKI